MKKVLSLVLAVVLALGMTTGAFAAELSFVKNSASTTEKAKNVVLMNYYGGGFSSDTFTLSEDLLVREKDVDQKVTALPVTSSSDTVTTFFLIKGTAADVTNAESLAIGTNTDGDWVFTKGDVKNTALYTGSGQYFFIEESLAKRWDLGVKTSKSDVVFTGADVKYATLSYPKANAKVLAASMTDADDEDEAWDLITAKAKLDQKVNVAVVEYKITDVLVSTGSKTAETTFSPYVNEKKMPTAADVKIKATIKNTNNKLEDPDTEEEIDADAYNLRQHELKGYVAKGTVNLEYDVIIKSRLYERKYYFHASNTPDTKAIAVMDKYNFEDYVKVTQINLTDSATITFDKDDSLYVYTIAAGSNYDAVADSVQLVYLGKSDKDLKFSGAQVTEYFFSGKEVTIETIAAPDDTEPPAESSEPDAPVSSTNPAGGPTEALPNNNYNPGTGC